MRTLAFVIAITIGFTGMSFAQSYCGIQESQADVVGSNTWDNLVAHMLDNPHDPYHWRLQEADYWVNTLSRSAPTDAVFAIIAADNSWDNASWKPGGAADFHFNYQGSTGHFAGNDDNKNVVSFQSINTYEDPPPLATTVYNAWEYNFADPFGEKDRLADVDTLINTRYYWAIGATANHYDLQSVMAHEFGHWLVLEHLYEGDHPKYPGCDEYLPAVMYYNINAATIKRTLHWIDKWGKWYIYTSGQVPMAPSGMPLERIPPPAQQHTAETLRTRLLNNYPDPFNPETWIPYELSNDADVRITIHDSSGALVRNLNIGRQAPGSYVERSKAAYWDGKDSNGQEVASGMYFYTLRADGYSETRRMVILK